MSKYIKAIYTVRLVEIDAEHMEDAIRQSEDACTGNEQVGQIIKDKLTADIKVKVSIVFE